MFSLGKLSCSKETQRFPLEVQGFLMKPEAVQSNSGQENNVFQRKTELIHMNFKVVSRKPEVFHRKLKWQLKVLPEQFQGFPKENQMFLRKPKKLHRKLRLRYFQGNLRLARIILRLPTRENQAFQGKTQFFRRTTL